MAKQGIGRPDLGSLLCQAASLPAMLHSPLLSPEALQTCCRMLGLERTKPSDGTLLFLLAITMN